jgi:hypothetical protein
MTAPMCGLPVLLLERDPFLLRLLAELKKYNA